MRNNRDIRGVKVKLNKSEIDNSELSYEGPKRYTLIRRPQANGSQLIAAVNITTSKIITFEYAKDKEDVRKAVQEVNRWMDKCYGGGKMSHKSRNRIKIA